MGYGDEVFSLHSVFSLVDPGPFKSPQRRAIGACGPK